MSPFHFYPATGTQPSLPLERFLPHISSGMVSSWLTETIPSGSWILDPFGISPHLIIEVAQAGYRVLTVSNNPIFRHIIEGLVAGNTIDEYRTALAELSAVRKGDERLETHITDLYRTQCLRCHQTIIAKAFIWKRQSDYPNARVYSCAYCGDEGERLIEPYDIELIRHLPNVALHKARAIERVAPQNDPHRTAIEPMIDFYLPRSLYALFTIGNKLDAIDLPKQQKRLLENLLLSAYNQATTLTQYPEPQPKIHQLSQPNRYIEFNIWSIFEDSIKEWLGYSTKIPLSYFPSLLSNNGIQIYRGKINELAKLLPSMDIRALITVFPKPNPAYWMFSVLWAGWMWGKDAIGPLKNVLGRKRFDWTWYTTAIYSTLKSITHYLHKNLPLFALASNVEPPFLTSCITATQQSGFNLSGLAVRDENRTIQTFWYLNKIIIAKENITGSTPAEAALNGIVQCLTERSEPASRLPLHSAGLLKLANDGYIPRGTISPSENYTRIQTALKTAFSDTEKLIRYEPDEGEIMEPVWWLIDPPADQMSLSDMIEMTTVNHLQKNPQLTFAFLEKLICEEFPQNLTPSTEIIKLCLHSYGIRDSSQSGLWSLRPQDFPSARRKDLEEIRSLLIKLANRLGYQSENATPLVWKDQQNQIVMVFYIIASSIINKYLNQLPNLAPQSIIVLPGGRANLLSYKLQHNPYLAQRVAKGWRFIKFRQLRRISSQTEINWESWLAQLRIDLPSYEGIQMSLF